MDFSTHNMKYLLLAAILFMFSSETRAQCGGRCSACAQRYGCRTRAWGMCCTQFYMHNGKRSDLPVLEGFVEYVKLKSKIVNPNQENSKQNKDIEANDRNQDNDSRMQNYVNFLKHYPQLLDVLRPEKDSPNGE